MCRCGGWLGRATLFELVSEVCGVHVSKLSKRGAWRFGKLLLGSKEEGRSRKGSTFADESYYGMELFSFHEINKLWVDTFSKW